MSVSTPDKNPEHLYPAFLTKLEKVLHEIATETACPWVIVEGFRSQARQDWLYAQGRTRPGKVVTWMKDPRWHGTGLAADVAPTHNGQVWYSAPRHYWQQLREIYTRWGLGNPAWENGDLGHIQSMSEDERVKAIAWLKGKGIG